MTLEGLDSSALARDHCALCSKSFFFSDSVPDALKMQLGPHPEATEGPHIPEAGAKYATLKFPGGGKSCP